LRNPLAPIVTALRVMELRGLPGGERERAVIGRQVEHLSRLVDDLLDVSRLASGKVRLARRAIEIADVVARAIEVTSPLLEERQHRLRVHVPRPGLAVLVDVERMTQVVCNLLTNSCKYTDAGGEIRVEARSHGEDVELRVVDTGVGIDPDMLPRVFDLFTQERQAIDRSRGGLGLGLALVRNLVRMHGGSVAAESAGRGRGSTFIVRIPKVQAAIADAAPPGVERTRIGTGSEAQRVLIVDDNRDAAEMLAELLGTVGHVVAARGEASISGRLAGGGTIAVTRGDRASARSVWAARGAPTPEATPGRTARSREPPGGAPPRATGRAIQDGPFRSPSCMEVGTGTA
ncbi:MAG: hybrid sensor histidine kinase/response regulator, partial [Myxococcales bacterium]|nr:hybrid sensor histidine kinase/response regulator [Myxococcales bacterium]